jgi:hypothetical protein
MKSENIFNFSVPRHKIKKTMGKEIEGGVEEYGIEKLEIEREKRRKRIIALTKELSENQESFPFPGIDADSYQKLKATDEGFSGFATPIDELIQRFRNEGIKVVFGNDPESGNVFILPFGSNDIESDSVSPKQLQPDESMDSRLGKLILEIKGMK